MKHMTGDLAHGIREIIESELVVKVCQVLQSSAKKLALETVCKISGD